MQSEVQLTAIAIIVIGPHDQAPYRSYRKPTKMIGLVAELEFPYVWAGTDLGERQLLDLNLLFICVSSSCHASMLHPSIKLCGFSIYCSSQVWGRGVNAQGLRLESRAGRACP